MEIRGYKLVMTSSACPEQYDVFKDDKQVGYLRLRHGYFYARCPSPGAEIVFQTETEGRGEFENHERAGYLDKAVNAIDKWVNNQEN